MKSHPHECKTTRSIPRDIQSRKSRATGNSCGGHPSSWRSGHKPPQSIYSPRCACRRTRSRRRRPCIRARRCTTIRGQGLPCLQTSDPQSRIHRIAATGDSRALLHETGSRQRIRILRSAVVVREAITSSECVALGHAGLHVAFESAGELCLASSAVIAAVDLPDVVGGIDESGLVPVGALRVY